MAATELFTNQAQTTVSSGGTTAPASGTVETWTVASSAPFAAAATGTGQFHVTDMAAGYTGEVIAVTNVSGTTWTVTRGAESVNGSTTPVAHLAGFTVQQAVTAGFLGTVSTLSPLACRLPNLWNAQWLAQKALGIAGTGTAKIAVSMSDSYGAGQSGGTVTDCLRYGWVGRLKTLLLGEMGLYAHGYAIASVNPGTLISPSSPYGASAPPSFGVADGGVGQVWIPSVTGSWFTFTLVQDVDTSGYATAADLLTVDFNGNTWSYTVDGGSPVTVTGAGSSNYQALIRRTSVTGLAGGETHAIALSNGGSNGLMFMGHVAYYGTSGLGIMRNGIGGYKAADFAVGNGASAGVITSGTAGASVSQDHIKPWAGYYVSSGDTYPCFANSASAGGFPWQPDLTIIMIGGNDCTYGSSPETLRKAVTRQIHAARRGIPANGSNGPGASILIVSEPYVSEYSDNASAISSTNPNPSAEWQRYKGMLRDLADEYTCGWLDLETVFGETPVARGLMVSGQVHATQNGLTQAAQAFTATNATPAVFTVPGTAPPNGTNATLTGSLPTGFSVNTTYFVVASSGSTFELAATSGGSAIASTSTGSGTVTYGGDGHLLIAQSIYGVL